MSSSTTSPNNSTIASRKTFFLLPLSFKKIILISPPTSFSFSSYSNLFTVLSHANSISVILLTQNLFVKGKVFRTVSLNSMYISLFKNPRDQSQVTNFAKQFSPYDVRWVVDAYRDCTRAPYTYMLFDSHQSTPDRIRVRSHILPGESGLVSPLSSAP